MSSWFSSFESATEALNSIGQKIGDELPSLETLNKIGNELSELNPTEAINGLSTKVQDALPLDNELINKLTLRSEELVREHELLDAQEKRKELVREYLSELLPWETHDESKEILVEKCQEEILKLSADKASFETPFLLMDGKMFNDDDYTEVTFEKVDADNDTDDDDDAATAAAAAAEEKAAEEKDNGDETSGASENKTDDGDSITTPEQKLQKMQPLPLLLEHFDIDTHVGLIERMMKADEKLVEMHSNLTGAGEKETLFWKNYFFHCAYTRYQSGLNVEEIWSSKPKAIITGNNEMTSTSMARTEPSLIDIVNEDDVDGAEELDLDFDEEDLDENVNIVTRELSAESLHSNSVETATITKSKSNEFSGVTHNDAASLEKEDITEFEIVNEAIATMESTDGGLDDDDMDDLEAEIARELGED